MKNKKLLELKNLIETADFSLKQAHTLLAEMTGESVLPENLHQTLQAGALGAEQIIEGVFNGQDMIGPDGKEYSIPANYASKSKLVEGDVLKLTIKPDGTFIYKQINPREREHTKGTLVFDHEHGEYRALLENGKSYKLLSASVTYFKGEPNDEVIILLPKGGVAEWAALENVIKNSQ
jgi:hypothetical protein